MRLPLLCLTLVLATLVLTSSLSTNDTTTRLQTIRGTFLADYDEFIERTEALSATVDSAIHDTASITQARNAYITMRLSYKRIEMLLEYIDGDYVNYYINGAPLPKSDRESSIITIFEPEGQQIIEELLFSDEATHDSTLALLANRAALLRDNAKQFRPFVRNTPLTDLHCIALLRQSIVRLVTMGITGFDSPASGNAMHELRVNAERIAWLASLYSNTLPSAHRTLQLHVTGLSKGLTQAFVVSADGDLKKRNSAAIDGGVNLTQQAFDKFDRASFIRNWADPLFGAIYDMQQVLGIESVADITSTPQPTNWQARHIFESSLFNTLYYAGIPAKQYSPALVELGRTLFFDPILSTSNDRACASCHKPEMAFTDGVAKSVALNHDGHILRNAPTIINAALADRYFYDLRAARLEDVIEHVVTNKREFGSTVTDMVARVRASDEYVQMFEAAYPTANSSTYPTVQGERIHSWSVGQAIAAYVVSLTSFNSPVDRYLRGENVSMSAPVRRGFNLFMGKAACGTCHFAPTFTGLVPPRFIESESEVLGVPTEPVVAHATLDPDIGRFDGTIKDQVAFLRHSFKTMTVRNVALTAPYMHNGVYRTLEQVVDFYNRGGGDGIGIPLKFQTLPFDKLDLTTQEQHDLVSFMKALTDTTGFGARPSRLPTIDGRADLNKRVIGGVY